MLDFGEYKGKSKQVLMVAYTNYRTDARVRREAETLAANSEHAVRCLVLKEPNQKGTRTYQLEGVTVEELNISKSFGRSKVGYLISYSYFFLLAFLKCTGKLLTRATDIIHVHNMPDFLVFVAILPRLFGKTLILDIHDTVPEHYASKFETSTSGLLFRMLCLEERISCALAQSVICVNHVQRDLLARRGIPKDKITILLNVPDHKIFRQQPKGIRKVGDRIFKMVYHGTLARRLGTDLVISAMAELTDEIPGLQFHMFGLGRRDYLEELLRLRRTLNVEDRVFCNFDLVPVDQVPGILMNMDLGIVSMRRNIATELAVPVKMLEYIKLGIPVVASRLKTVEYYFTEDMVSYFMPDNVNSMADAIVKMYKDPIRSEQQAMNAKMFLEEYGWEKHRLGLMKLYERDSCN